MRDILQFLFSKINLPKAGIDIIVIYDIRVYSQPARQWINRYGGEASQNNYAHSVARDSECSAYIDANNGIIVKSCTAEKSAKSIIKVERFCGDEEALTKESAELCRKDGQYLKGEKILVQNTTQKVSKELSNKITFNFR